MSSKEEHLVSTVSHYKHQQLFDMAVRGLASQSFTRSISHTGVCAYRGEGGKRCAVGWCIPDEKYIREMELGKLANDKEIVLAADAFLCSPTFLRNLQGCHDLAGSSRSAYPFGELNLSEDAGVVAADMKDRLKRLAFDWELTIPSDVEL